MATELPKSDAVECNCRLHVYRKPLWALIGLLAAILIVLYIAWIRFDIGELQ